ncbi:MAG: flagellar hook-length control protein FliK [Pseudomonadota bacterium]
MAVNDVLNQLQLLIQGSAPKLIEVTDQTKVAVPFVPGERYTAKVQEQIANGRFLVLIRDQKLDLNLPRNTQPGQNIELRFVSADPRLTFVQAGEPLPPGQSQAAVNLSDGGRYLNALLDRVKDLATRQPQSQSQTSTSTQGQAAQIINAKPIIDGAPPPLAQFAALLKDTVIKSGLFYESHQAQWAAGDRPLTELLREPQGRLSEPRAFTAAQQAANAAQATLASTPLGQAPKVDLPNPLAPVLSNSTSTQEPVHPQTAPLVQQQLETLDQRQLLWQGQVWPGQDMRWQIEERSAREGEQDAEREWQTRLELSLPHLGQVSALLKFTPQGIRIELAAPASETAQALQSAGPLLNQGMERAGLHLIEMKVETNDGSA